MSFSENISEFLDKQIKEKELYLRRGLELARYPIQSKEINEVAAAFAKAQGEFPAISKGTKGFNYKYAELSNILNMVRPVLAQHDLYFQQYMTRDNMLHTRIGHVSGQWFESQFVIPIPTEKEFYEIGGKKTSYMQEIGSRRTYARRYEAITMLGIHPEGEDDDGRGYVSKQY